MADPGFSRITVNSTGTVTVRQRPTILLMKVRLRANEPTLELGLAKLKVQTNAASQWLARLGAGSVTIGEPHFDEHVEQDPVTKMRTVTASNVGKQLGGAGPDSDEHGVNVVVTALWQVASKSAEEILVLLDRLRFEASDDDNAPEAADESPTWTSPEEQFRGIMSQMFQPPSVDRRPKFLFIARLEAERLEASLEEAFSRACANSEQLARAAGLRLGRLSPVNYGHARVAEGRPDKMMERQRCAALLAGTTYDLGDYDVVSDDPRPAEFTVSVNVHHMLEDVAS
jgi:hypothetical protein